MKSTLFIILLSFFAVRMHSQTVSPSNIYRQVNYIHVNGTSDPVVAYQKVRRDGNIVPAYATMLPAADPVAKSDAVLPSDIPSGIAIDTVFLLGENLVECYTKTGQASSNIHLVLRDLEMHVLNHTTIISNNRRTAIVSDINGFYLVFRLEDDEVRVVRLSNELKMASDVHLTSPDYKNPQVQQVISGEQNTLLLVLSDDLNSRKYAGDDGGYTESIFVVHPDGDLHTFAVNKDPGSKYLFRDITFLPSSRQFISTEILATKVPGKPGRPGIVHRYYIWDETGAVVTKNSTPLTIPESDAPNMDFEELTFDRPWKWKLNDGRLVVLSDLFHAGGDKYFHSRLALVFQEGDLIKKRVITDFPPSIFRGVTNPPTKGEYIRFLIRKSETDADSHISCGYLNLETMSLKETPLELGDVDKNLYPFKVFQTENPDVLILQFIEPARNDERLIWITFE